MRRFVKVMAIGGLIALGLSGSGQAQAQYVPGYRPNQGGYYRNYGNYGYSPSGRPYASPYQGYNYGRSPSGRYYTAPRYNYTPTYRRPSPYLPGGSLYSPFNMGRFGSGSPSHAPSHN